MYVFVFFIFMILLYFFFFFFSSRRRHTRWNCDWSSDVCSSDLYRNLLPNDYLDLPGAVDRDSRWGEGCGKRSARSAHGRARLPMHQQDRQGEDRKSVV